MDEVRLRPATLADAELLFAWRNDPLTRAQSIHTEPVVWERHLAWLAASLQNPDRQLFIAEQVLPEMQVPVVLGTVRADKIGEGYELSWTVALERRGNGWGEKMVAALIATLPAGAAYQAIVLNTNPASGRIAIRLGMTVQSSTSNQTLFAARKPSL
jgi:RimJ/RimL family protein N-acetyltransferase